MRERELDLSRSWTESEYLALGETDIRYELINGKLTVTPSANRPHQGISFLLMTFLKPSAARFGLRAFEAVDIRLAHGTIVTPDIAVGKLSWGTGVADAADVVLVAEITSPSNAKHDRVAKMALYAAAGIPWYLLVEPDMSDYGSVALRLLRLDGAHYVAHAAAQPGRTLRSEEPFPLIVDTADLVEPDL
jgi:Uma2 family endonuclease